MKKKTLQLLSIGLCLLVSSLQQIKAQSPIWIQSNAVWHYDFDNFNGTNGFLKIRYIGDTLIDGHTAQILTSTSYVFFTDQNDISHLTGIYELDTNYTWNNQNQVFYWVNNQFELLYDFTKLTGESFAIHSTEDPTFFCNPISMANVTGTGNVTLAGQNYPTIDLGYNDGDHTRLQGPYNARFGNQSMFFTISGLFPMQTMTCDPGIIVEYSQYRFSCFQDDGLTINPLNIDCEYQLTHVGMTELNEDGYLLYPNPTNNFATLVSPFDQNEVKIFNLSGQVVFEMETANKLEEFTFNLAKGTYLLKVSSGNEWKYSEKLVIQ
ncbi:MAG: T9SS type A sorting domain-containing protein [Flavobacteriales bacterium]